MEKEFYEENGFLILRNFLSTEEVALVLNELTEIVSALKKQISPPSFSSFPGFSFKINPPPFTAFSNPRALEALRESTNGCFLFGSSETLIDTVGHGVHRLEGSFIREITTSKRILDVCNNTCNLNCPTIAQSKFVMKPASGGAKVPIHNDEQYIFSHPESGLAFWIALDPADEKNGRLSVLPKSHKNYAKGQKFWVDGPIARWFIQPEAKQQQYKHDDDNKIDFPVSKKEQDEIMKNEKWLDIDCAPGDCVVMHHALLHTSQANKSKDQRRAYTIHLIDGSCEFPKQNWLLPGGEGFEKLNIKV